MGRDWDGFVLLVGGFVPVVLASSLAMWRLTGRITPVQVLTLIIMSLAGALTVGFNDERFFKMRTTLVCLTLSVVLWVGLARGQALLSGVMGGMVTLSPAGWTWLTRRFAAVLLVLAAANEAVWRSFSTDVWVAYNTFVMPAGFFGYLALTIRRARRLGQPATRGHGTATRNATPVTNRISRPTRSAVSASASGNTIGTKVMNSAQLTPNTPSPKASAAEPRDRPRITSVKAMYSTPIEAPIANGQRRLMRKLIQLANALVQQDRAWTPKTA